MAKGQARSGFDIDLEDGLFDEARLASILRLKGNFIEVKSDERCAETGNLFIEIRQPDGNGGLKKSGLAITESNWWASWITPEACLVVTTDSLKSYCKEKWSQQKSKSIVRGGDRDAYHGMLVKVSDLLHWLRKRFSPNVR